MHRRQGSASGRRSPLEWIPALAVALALASPVSADVILKQKTVSEGLGGFGNSSVEKTLTVSGDKSRSDETSTYTGRFKSLAGGKPKHTVSITRLDKQLIWNLDPDHKQYTEMTFAELKALYEKGTTEGEQAQAENPPQDVDMKFTVDVKKTGAHQTINGYPCDQVIVTCTGKATKVTKPASDGQVSEVHMVFDQWLSTSVPGAEELGAFSRKMAEEMGIDPSTSNISPMARRMYGKGLEEMAAKFKDLKGYPVRSTFTIEGPPASAEQQQAMADAQKAMAQAEAEQQKAERQQAEQEKAENAQDAADLGKDIASGGGGIAGKLGGFFGKKAAKSAQKKADKKAEEKAKEMASPSAGTAGGPLLKVVTDLVEVSASPAPAGSFEIPAGYKKKG